MHDPRRALLRPLLVLLALAGVGRAEAPPRLKAAWKERDLQSLAFAPGGRALVSTGGEGSRLRDAETGEVRAVLSADPLRPEGMRFAPDGRLVFALVMATDHEPVTIFDLRAWDTATGRVHGTIPYVAETLNGFAEHYALAPDGRTLAALDNTPRLPVRAKSTKMEFDDQTFEVFSNASTGLPRVMLWSVPAWKPLGILDGGSRLLFSPDGSLLATGCRDWQGNATLVWKAATGELRVELDGDTPWNRPMAFSPDGRLLAVCGWRENALWELAGRRRWAIPAANGGDRAPVFSPDGTLLFPNGLPGGDASLNMNRDFPCYDVSTLPPRRINLGAGQHVVQPLTSHEPRLLIAPAAMRYAAFGAADASGRRRLTIHALPDRRAIARSEVDGLDRAEFSADGRWLALSVGVHGKRPGDAEPVYRKEVRLVDPATAKVRATIPSPAPPWWDHHFSLAPDGRSVAITYRTGDNAQRAGEPDPMDRPMNVEIWEIPPG